MNIREAGLAAQSLELRMEEAALEARRRWSSLDGTVESLDVVERILARGALADAEVEQLAAYVGETVRHLSGAGTWRVTRFRVAAASGPEGALTIGRWDFDSYDFLQHHNGPLAEQVDEVIRYFRSPTEGTAEGFGWKKVELDPVERADPWTELRDDVAFWWHRLRDWYLRRRVQFDGGLDRGTRESE